MSDGQPLPATTPQLVVAAAMEAASEETILVDFDVMAGEMVVNWDALAEAAIEALQLREEWALRNHGANDRVYFMSEEAAKEKAQRWPESFRASCRVVGPWRTTPTEGAEK
jgi:hypothetical protein